MPLDFPDSPPIGQFFTTPAGAWRWDGVKWVAYPLIAGTDPTGVIDSTAGLQAAFNDPAHPCVVVPPGSYRVDGTLIVAQNNAQIIGQSAILTSFHPTADLFRLAGQNQVVANMQFQQAASVPRTAGALLHVMPSAIGITIDYPILAAGFYGIWLDGCSTVDVWGGRILATVAGGHAIRVTGGFALSLNGIVMENTSVVASQPEAGIYVASCGDLTISDVLVIHTKYGLWAHPTGAEIADNICVTHSQFDSCGTYGVFINPSGATAAVRRSDFVQCWVATSGSTGAQLTIAAGGTIKDLQFTNLKAVNNGTTGPGDGLQAATDGITGLNILGGAFAGNQNGAGINLGPVDHWSLIGATVGAADGFVGNSIGLAVNAASHHFNITGCNFDGNTTAVTMGPGIDGAAQSAINNVGWVPAPGTWTPTDSSGAALALLEGLPPGESAEGRALAAATGRYIRVGNIVHAYGSVTYPTTANTATAGIGGLPFAVPAGTQSSQGFITYCSASTARYLAPNAGGTTAGFYNAAGLPINNAAMSGAIVYFEFIYPAS